MSEILKSGDEPELIALGEWQKRAYAQLMYAFMLRATIDWYLWGMGWDIIESAPAEVIPPLPCEPNWRALPYWVKWWAIDGNGTIRAFHLKPMGGGRERHVWFLGAHGPQSPGLPVEMIVGYLGTQAEPIPVRDWYMTLRRRPAHLELPGPEPVSELTPLKRKSKKKEAVPCPTP